LNGGREDEAQQCQRLSASRAKGLCGNCRSRRRFQRWGGRCNERWLLKHGLYPLESGALIVRQEIEVTHLDKTHWENMLEKALNKLFHRQGVVFDAAAIRSALFEGHLRRFQAALIAEGNQSAILKRNAVNVSRQVFESGLPIPYRQAVDHPIARPDIGGY
jgi:hypothetical protein